MCSSTIPSDCWSLIQDKLSCNDVLSMKQVWPECITHVPNASVFNKLIPGGVNICEDCAKETITKALTLQGPKRRDFTESCDDPTGTFDSYVNNLRDDDGETLYQWIPTDILSLTTRRLLEHPECFVEKYICGYCENFKIIDKITETPGWKKLMKKYIRLASKPLKELYLESNETDQESGYDNLAYMMDRFDLPKIVCTRCGKLECSHNECEWKFGGEYSQIFHIDDD